ncbi:MAG: hypothetical protein HC904_13400 [Blastochloris sp.]|nr:hypothetical protein [Blastochloris sp.]
MKTITLTEDAYQRLKSWKSGPGMSFSKVVLERVPKRGTLGDLLESVTQLPKLSESQAALMQQEVSLLNDWKQLRDPWTEGTEGTGKA